MPPAACDAARTMTARSLPGWLVRTAVLALATGSLGVTCGSPTPAPAVCDAPGPLADGAITSLEVGGTVDGQFAPFVDGGVVPLAIGGQGAPMVVARLRVRGSGLPECLAQATSLERLDGSVESSENSAMATTPAGADGVVTGDIFLPYYGESAIQVRLRATVGARTQAVIVWIEAAGTVDAGVVAR